MSWEFMVDFLLINFNCLAFRVFLNKYLELIIKFFIIINTLEASFPQLKTANIIKNRKYI